MFVTMSDTQSTSVDFLNQLQAGRSPFPHSMEAVPEAAAEPAPDQAAGQSATQELAETQAPQSSQSEEVGAKVQEGVVAEQATGDPLEELLKDTEPQSLWDDNSKKAFAQEFGTEDPAEFKKQYSTLKEEREQLAQRSVRLEQIEANLGKLPLDLEEVLADYLQGKGADPISRIKSMGVSASQKADDVEATTLVDTYFKGKFTPEDLEAIRDKEADEDLETRFGHYKEMAQEKHMDRHEKWSAREQQRTQELTQQKEAVERSRIEAVANLKSNKALASMVDPAMIDDFVQGRLEAKSLYNQDGTYKADALTRLAKAELFDKLVERMRTGVQAKAEMDGRLKERTQQPQGPSPSGGQRSPQTQRTPEQEVTSFLDKAQAGRLPR